MDWKSLIAELQARGITQVQMSELCGCSQSIVSYLATGRSARPRYEIGQALIELQHLSKRELERRIAGLEPKAA